MSGKLWAFMKKGPFGNELHEEVHKGVLGKGGAGGFQGKGVGPQGWHGMGEGTVKEQGMGDASIEQRGSGMEG